MSASASLMPNPPAPHNSNVEAQTPVWLNLGRGPFRRQLRLNKGGALTQQDWCPGKKWKRHQGCARTGEDRVGTEQEGSCSQGRERGLTGNPPYQHLCLVLPSLQNCEKINFVAEVTQAMVFCYGSPSRPVHVSLTQRNNRSFQDLIVGYTGKVAVLLFFGMTGRR